MQDTKQSTSEVTKYPYIYNSSTSGRKGQHCRPLVLGGSGALIQVEFEDGTLLIVHKMNLRSGNKKKYSEKRGRPYQTQSTLAPKQQIDQGE